MADIENINLKLTQPLLTGFPLPEGSASAFSYISIDEYPIHSHLHMELIYVAKGSIRVKVGFSNYVLYEGEFAIINPFELHALYSTEEDNHVCILEISTDFYDPIHEEVIFVSAYSLYEDAAGNDFARIYDTIYRLFTLHLSAALSHNNTIIFPSGIDSSNAEYEKILLRSLINYFELHFTSEYFLIKGEKESSLRDNALQANRLKIIITYFYTHFPQKIQLQDIADMTYVNKYHISHLIKSGTGLTFQEFLQQIRIEKAEVYLLCTEIPVNQIVFELGFSSYRYFNQHFKNMFNMTPAAYRKKYQQETIKHKNISYMASISSSDMHLVLARFDSANLTTSYNTDINFSQGFNNVIPCMSSCHTKTQIMARQCSYVCPICRKRNGSKRMLQRRRSLHL